MNDKLARKSGQGVSIPKAPGRSVFWAHPTMVFANRFRRALTGRRYRGLRLQVTCWHKPAFWLRYVGFDPQKGDQFVELGDREVQLWG